MNPNSDHVTFFINSLMLLFSLLSSLRSMVGTLLDYGSYTKGPNILCAAASSVIRAEIQVESNGEGLHEPHLFTFNTLRKRRVCQVPESSLVVSSFIFSVFSVRIMSELSSFDRKASAHLFPSTERIVLQMSS